MEGSGAQILPATPLLPIIKPQYTQKDEVILNEKNDNIAVRCCRKKYTCVFTALICCIMFVTLVNDILKRMDEEESFMNINNILNFIYKIQRKNNTNQTDVIFQP